MSSECCSSGRLRTFQIIVFIISSTAGLVVSISVGWTSKILSGKCVLHSDMRVKPHNNGTLSVLESVTEWGNPTECTFSTFSPVGVTIYCIIWIWFYIFLSDWGTSFIEDKQTLVKDEPSARTPQDQHLLIPSIVCNIAVLGLVLATVAILEAGASEWCENIEIHLSDKPCEYLAHTKWLNIKDGQDIYGYLSHAKISCWVLLFSMVFQTVIIFIRLRRNTRRPRLSSTLSEVSEPLSDPFPEPFSDSDNSVVDSAQAPTRRRLQRQKRVVIVDVADQPAGTSSTVVGEQTA